jgi:uncharacterized cupredoxin-like copper-binding protein
MKNLYALSAAAWLLVAAPAQAHTGEHHGTHAAGAAATTATGTTSATAASTGEQAFGRPGDPKRAQRTVTVDMADTMRYLPAEIIVTQGETVRFVVANKGKMLHEMVLGTEAELKKHAEQMRRSPGMEHSQPWMVHVKPGGKEGFAWTFTKAGVFDYACLLPGHFEAGMKGRIVVKPR